MLRTSSQVIQLAGGRAIAPGQVCLLVPRHLRCFSNRYLLGLIDDRQDHPVRWLLTTQGHLDEGPSEEGNPTHAPLIKLCVLAQGRICFEGAPFSNSHEDWQGS